MTIQTMRHLRPRTAILVALLTACVAVQRAVDIVVAEKGFFKDIFNQTVGRVASYAIGADTIEFVNESDFDSKGDMLRVVELAPGDAIKYTCGKHGSAATGKFMLVPADPSTHVLSPKGDDPVEVAAKRVVPSYNVYRSDRSLVINTFQNIGLDHLLLDYAKDTILMAKNPNDFSMNLLCIYIPAAVDSVPRYRWLQIKFKEVLPMAYGCGSSGFHMFKNAIPLPIDPTHEQIHQASHCTIEGRPGMVVGLYCAKNDHIYPDDCFNHIRQNDNGQVMMNTVLDPAFPQRYDNVRLMRLTRAADNYNSSFTCLCKNDNGMITASVKVSLRNEELCDLNRMLRMFESTKMLPRYMCNKRIGAGRTVSVVVPKPDGLPNFKKLVGGLSLYPKAITNETYVAVVGNSRMKRVRLDHLIGSSGLRISHREEGGNYVYNFRASENAIIVLKQQVASLTYVYEYYDMFSGAARTSRNLISLPILPTDPYTHGCGVGGTQFFNQDGVSHSNEYLKTGYHYHLTVGCTVNGWASSPVGFYCPKDHILEPADCFTSVIVQSTNRVALLSSYAPHARVINAPNLKVVDFSFPASIEPKIAYSDEALTCRCKRKDGTIMATITVDLRNPEHR